MKTALRGGFVVFAFSFGLGIMKNMNKKKLVVGNWKLGPITLVDAKKTFENIKKEAAGIKKTEVVLCPPYIFISELAKIAGSRCKIGAQNAFWEAEGAFTGEVSPEQLAKFKISHVILGHSERRAMGETDDLVSKKVAAVLRVGMVAILCVGEKERDGEGKYLNFLEQQLRASLAGIPKRSLENIVIAYEPIWAIGAKATGAIAPADLEEMIIFIRKILSHIYDQEAVRAVPILYGGSVNERNCGDFLQQRGVSGLLVGRASLQSEKFIKIIKIAEALPSEN